MRKLVIGVVAVLVLHIAFTNYMARDRANLAEERAKAMDALRGITPVVDAAPPVFELASLWQEPAADAVVQPRQALAVRPRRNIIEPTTAAYKRSKSTPSVSYASHTPRKDPPTLTRPLENTTILIKASPRVRTEYPVGVPATAVASSEDEGRKKKRSSDPLVFAVVKKPASWVKSLVAKVF